VTHVLVVDDDAHILRTLRIHLTAHGYSVVTAETGGDAIAAAGADRPDLVVLDLGLPDIDGTAVIAALRRKSTVPIIVLSARRDAPDKVHALDTGADDYVTKPFHFHVLLARIRSLLRRGSPERPVALTVGDLGFDPATREVTRAGESVRLTTREVSLLEFLMRRAGDVVTKAQILEHVWDYEFEGDPNIVEVYVGRLRRKVDRPFGRSDIETLRGAGYRLRADG